MGSFPPGRSGETSPGALVLPVYSGRAALLGLDAASWSALRLVFVFWVVGPDEQEVS